MKFSQEKLLEIIRKLHDKNKINKLKIDRLEKDITRYKSEINNLQ
jgi:hypothetical protein